MAGPDRTISYRPAGPTIREFHRSEAFVRGIMGPIGSGKSTACVLEIIRRAKEQAPSPDGMRRSRWAIIRNSYPELRTTTLKTWNEWVPQKFGKLTMDSPIRHAFVAGDMDVEVYFMALDREDDVRKLLSLELTGAWVNEAREVPKAIIDALTGRVGRFPSKAQGGASWSGIIMDTNPPDDQSWWYRLAEEETPDGWRFFSQPPGDEEGAENLENLPHGYYARLKPGKDEDWIKVYVKGRYGYLIEGKPVFSMWRDSIHVAKEVIQIVPNLPILVGADFGLTPAAIFGQRLADGRWQIVDEYLHDNCGNIKFAELVLQYAIEKFPSHAVVLPQAFETEGDHMMDGFGDPAGLTRAQSDERTAIEIMQTYTGWRWRAAPSNDPTMRKECVIAALNRMVDGRPGFLLSPVCKTLRKGFSSGYHYKYIRSATGSQTQVHETPAKNEYSHPHDGLQYLMLGGGEHNVVLNRAYRKKRTRSRVAKDVDYNIYG